MHYNEGVVVCDPAERPTHLDGHDWDQPRQQEHSTEQYG